MLLKLKPVYAKIYSVKGTFMINPFDYFINLDDLPLNKSGSFILKDHLFKNETNIDNCYFEFYNIFDNSFFTKPLLASISYSLQVIAAGYLYCECDLLSPPVYIAKNKLLNFFEVSQNLTKMPALENCDNVMNFAKVASTPYLNKSDEALQARFNIYQYKDYQKIIKWLPLYNAEAKELFLSVMTPECFDEYINMFLIDELRTEYDRHSGNFMTCKDNKTGKYTKIIPIDNECVEILETLSYGSTKKLSKTDFYYFLKNEYTSYAPINVQPEESPLQRIETICRLLQDGVLSQSNIRAIKSALGFDFAKSIKDIGKRYGLSEAKINRAYTPIAYLWEYNNKVLGKELGL